MPLVGYTWSRDIELREDVSIADDISSFTNTELAASGTPNPNGKNWIGKNSTEIATVNLDINKTGFPLTLWGWNLAGLLLSWLPRSRSAARLMPRNSKACS